MTHVSDNLIDTNPAIAAALQPPAREFAVQQNWDGAAGWEDVAVSDDIADARRDYRDYRENQPTTPVRMISRRVK